MIEIKGVGVIGGDMQCLTLLTGMERRKMTETVHQYKQHTVKHFDPGVLAILSDVNKARYEMKACKHKQVQVKIKRKIEKKIERNICM